MKHKRYAISLALILGVVMVSGCYRPSDEPAGDWNTYRNEKYGYAFMYPSDCLYGPMPSDCKEKPPEQRRSECLCFLDATNPDVVFMQAFLGEGDHLTLAGLSISHYDTPVYHPVPGTELGGWLHENFSEIFENIPDAPNMEIDGTPAVRIYSPQSPMAPSFEEIYYLQNDELFRINMLDVDHKDNRELYEQMLARFSLEE